MDKTLFVTADPSGNDSVIGAGYCFFDGNGAEEYTSRASLDHRLIYVKRGVLRVMRKGADVVTARAPALVLLSPGSRDSLACSSDCQDYWVSFEGFFDTLSELLIDSHEALVKDASDKDDMLTQYFEDIIAELQLGECGFGVAARARLLRLFLFFSRGTFGAVASADSLKKKILPALVAMNSEFSITYPMDYYAKKCNMSKSSFLHSFSKIMQTTPIKYLNAIKLKNAIPLLLDTALPIGRVAQSLGFSSAQYFSNIFTAYYGISPREYRRGGKREI
jgi:AraC-like DNA-binding protein